MHVGVTSTRWTSSRAEIREGSQSPKLETAHIAAHLTTSHSGGDSVAVGTVSLFPHLLGSRPPPVSPRRRLHGQKQHWTDYSTMTMDRPNIGQTQYRTDPIPDRPNIGQTQYRTDPISDRPNIGQTQYRTDPISDRPNSGQTQYRTDPISDRPNTGQTQYWTPPSRCCH